ncbi:MAG: hypothetical protein JSR80_01040 [Verrucomicrobia bacterium]|nr:hypothetical protein [Verrucomicrobiota bacterium]
MMKETHNKKNKLVLADYDYRKDIENRLLMSTFTLFDVEVLEEILHSSLTLQLSQLISALEGETMQVIESVDKLSQTGLLKREGEMITVDKEMRKYYEFQVRKFDDDFRPDMEFLQALLRTVPIHVLPLWYNIPRTSTNIFQSLIERYLHTPRTYQRYLLELQFDEPVMQQILDEVFASEDYMVRSKTLREKFNISREKFEEYMLMLEFHFICCLSYKKIGDHWKEVVTPFQEWRDYLRFLRDTQPKALPKTTVVEELYSGACGFAKEAHALLSALPKNPPYDQRIAAKLKWLGLIEGEGQLKSTPLTAEWVKLDLEEFALALYRHCDNQILSKKIPLSLQTERNLREVEKALMRIKHYEWVSFDDFLKGMVVGFGTDGGSILEKKGRHWRYSLPEYTAEEKNFIHAAIFERFVESGFVSVSKDEKLFRLTPFGRMILS